MHAFIRDTGSNVSVALEDGRTAGFPYMNDSADAWEQARAWAKEHGATTSEERKD